MAATENTRSMYSGSIEVKMHPDCLSWPSFKLLVVI
uniref:Uncharacterized protein n=1 Tax=Anguilla anguilla TaxID=7936 RepID=A0A0E9WLX4_ANGAN